MRTCIGRRGSRLPATADRCSSRRRRPRSSTPAGLRDLGEHRLKDLSAPERIFQLGDDDFPPLKTLYRTNLPIPATPFLGREHELAEVRKLLARDDARLLTLTGAGGSGKTRLALQAAGDAAEAYPRRRVVGAARAARRTRPTSNRQRHGRSAAAGRCRSSSTARRLLLLLDNFEHVVEAAPEVAAGSSPSVRTPTCS